MLKRYKKLVYKEIKNTFTIPEIKVIISYRVNMLSDCIYIFHEIQTQSKARLQKRRKRNE